MRVPAPGRVEEATISGTWNLRASSTDLPCKTRAPSVDISSISSDESSSSLSAEGTTRGSAV